MIHKLFFACRGSVIKVKLLGAVALIDEGETDWKVLAIDVEDPLASEIDDITGLEAKMPGKPCVPNQILLTSRQVVSAIMKIQNYCTALL